MPTNFEEAVLSQLGNLQVEISDLKKVVADHTAREAEVLRMYRNGKILVKGLIYIGAFIAAMASAWAWVMHNIDVTLRR